MIARMLILSEPKVIETWEVERPCIVFSDGAVENGRATCGAVVKSPRTVKMRYFGMEVHGKQQGRAMQLRKQNFCLY
eukprot:156203-Amphidinium_carterae.1